ncbi:MAG: hypothetical protein M3R32_01180 [Chloroflexota bacterium]|nr:hypothetical protein [Chloroflexota bacterium]
MLRSPERAARLFALAVAVLGVLLLIGAAFSVHVRPDAQAYWLAAQRLREGLPLYGGPRGDETEVYRYAPWFAFAWVPLTYLGHDAAFSVWRGILVIATVGAIWPLIRRPSPASVTLAILIGGLLISALPPANATPLMVGGLAMGLRTRAGPIVLGLAGSLKVFPLLLVAGYVAERRWLHAAIAIGISAILWAHLLAFDLRLYSQIGGPSFYLGGVSLLELSVLLWLPVAIVCLVTVVGLAARKSPWTWLAAGAAIPLAVPRVWLPDAAYVLPGALQALRSTDLRRGPRVGNGP